MNLSSTFIRALQVLAVSVLMIGLTACGIFGPDPAKTAKVDAVVDGFSLTEAGDIVVDYSAGSGTAFVIYTRQIVVRGPKAETNVRALLLEAGFEPLTGTLRNTYELSMDDYDFTVRLSVGDMVKAGTGEQGKDGRLYNSEIGDVRVTITTTM